MDPMNEPLADDEPQGSPKPWRLAAIFGVISAVILGLISWVTGLYDSVGKTIAFTLLAGLFSTAIYGVYLSRRAGK